MAIQKTVIRRYAGTEIGWESVYLSTSSDIVVFGDQATLSESSEPYAVGDVIAANSSIRALILRVMNHMVNYDYVSPLMNDVGSHRPAQHQERYLHYRSGCEQADRHCGLRQSS